MSVPPRVFLEKDHCSTTARSPTSSRSTWLGERAYLVRVADDGTLPDPEECEVVERLVAQRILTEDAYGRQQRAD